MRKTPSMQPLMFLFMQWNTQGELGYRFRAPLFFSGEGLDQQRTNLFINDSSDNGTFTYRALDSVTEATTTMTVTEAFRRQLSDQGAEGFEFGGQLSVQSTELGSFGQTDFFVKRDGSTDTFDYALEPQRNTAAEFLMLLNTRGAEGWEWLSTFVIGEGLNVNFQELFVRRIGSPARFDFRALAAEATQEGALAQMNSEGASQYRFVGPLFLPGSIASSNLFVRDSSRARTFAYTALANEVTRNRFVIQADAQGPAGAYYKGPIFLGAENFSLYVSSAAREVASLPVLMVTTSLTLTFTPMAAGSFQLERSTTLTSWEPVDSAEHGRPGIPIIWDRAVDRSIGPKLFYRVAKQ